MTNSTPWLGLWQVTYGLVILGGACTGTSGLRDLANLQSAVSQQFQEPATSVHLSNGAHLTITFQNSVKAQLPADNRAAFAREVAAFVRNEFPGYERLETISIGFVTRRGAGPVSMSRTEVPYRFTPAELGHPESDSAATTQRRPAN